MKNGKAEKGKNVYFKSYMLIVCSFSITKKRENEKTQWVSVVPKLNVKTLDKLQLKT